MMRMINIRTMASIRTGAAAATGAITGKAGIAALAAALAFASCSGGDTPAAEDGAEVAFGAKGAATAETRAEVTTGLRKIGVFGYSHTGDFDNDTTLHTPDFFLNQAVVDLPGDGTWTYSGVRKYWPWDGRRLSFFAYAPFIDVENTFVLHPSSSDDAGAPSITYNVPAGILDQIDLIYGSRQNMLYVDSNGGKVDFTLDHALTRVDFVVRLDASEMNRPFVVTFNELTLRNVSGGGRLDMSRPLADPGVWTTARPADDTGWAVYRMTPGGRGGLANLVFDARVITADFDAGQNSAWDWNRLFVQGQYLMLIPQDLDDKGDGLTPAEISLKYTVSNVHTSEVWDVEEVIPLARAMLPAWNPGAGVTYQFTVSIETGTVIEFEIEEFIVPTPWENLNGGNPITGNVG